MNKLGQWFGLMMWFAFVIGCAMAVLKEGDQARIAFANAIVFFGLWAVTAKSATKVKAVKST